MDEEFADEEGTEYALIMPFVVCQSHGGPYEDAAFCAGWEMGMLDEQMKRMERAVAVESTIRAASLPQADLVYMKHGFQITSTVYDDSGEWAFVHAERKAAGDAS